MQTPRRCGQAFSAGALLRTGLGDRGLRINWLIVGMRPFSLPVLPKLPNPSSAPGGPEGPPDGALDVISSRRGPYAGLWAWAAVPNEARALEASRGQVKPPEGSAHPRLEPRLFEPLEPKRPELEAPGAPYSS